jgi:hypothetical protein
MKPLTPMEREIDLAALAAYREHIKTMWGNRPASLLDRITDAGRAVLREEKGE